MIISGTISMAVCWICAVEFNKYIHITNSILFEILKISAIALVCMVVYIPLNLLFKMEYAGELYNRLSAKILRK